MSHEIFLEKIQVNNFLSLRDAELHFKPLTVLVGPNASGKSNILGVLELLRDMLTANEALPASLRGKNFRKSLWAGGADKIEFEFLMKAGQKDVTYKLSLQAADKNRIFSENLTIDEATVISIQDGQGIVTDEDGKNFQEFRSNKLALKSAGDYGHKPVTKTVADFIRNWRFYDFRPDQIRKGTITAGMMRKMGVAGLPDRMDKNGEALGFLLYDWGESDRERFEAINEGLGNFYPLTISLQDDELCLLEGYANNIPLDNASDGVLRLLACQTLLIEPELPSLITIEEPERNLHPAALMELGSLLKDLSGKTQVIITTHSSHLLDMFDADALSNDLEIILLRNRHGQGTDVINIEKIREDRESLKDWMEEFGIGSAIFESQLLQDVMEI